MLSSKHYIMCQIRKSLAAITRQPAASTPIWIWLVTAQQTGCLISENDAAQNQFHNHRKIREHFRKSCGRTSQTFVYTGIGGN